MILFIKEITIYNFTIIYYEMLKKQFYIEQISLNC